MAEPEAYLLDSIDEAYRSLYCHYREQAGSEFVLTGPQFVEWHKNGSGSAEELARQLNKNNSNKESQ